MRWLDLLHRWLSGAAASKPVDPPRGPPPPPPVVPMPQPSEDSDELVFQIDTVARTLWGEARGEGAAGMTAVACVIQNRVRNPGWWSRHLDAIPDDTFAAVCRDPFQFSCWNDDDPNLPKLVAVTPDDAAFRIALALAADVVQGRLLDVTGGCDHYYVTGSPMPKWARGRVPDHICGRHVFFRIGRHG